MCLPALGDRGKQTRLHGVAQRTQGCLAGVSEVGTGKFSCQLASIFDSGPDRCAGDGEYIGFVRPSPAEKASPGWFGEIRNSLFHICIARSGALATSCIKRDSLHTNYTAKQLAPADTVEYTAVVTLWAMLHVAEIKVPTLRSATKAHHVVVSIDLDGMFPCCIRKEYTRSSTTSIV